MTDYTDLLAEMDKPGSGENGDGLMARAADAIRALVEERRCRLCGIHESLTNLGNRDACRDAHVCDVRRLVGYSGPWGGEGLPVTLSAFGSPGTRNLTSRPEADEVSFMTKNLEGAIFATRFLAIVCVLAGIGCALVWLANRSFFGAVVAVVLAIIWVVAFLVGRADAD